MYLCDIYEILPIAYFIRCQFSVVFSHLHFSEYYIVKMVDTEVVKSVIEAFDPEETKHDTTNDICLSLGQNVIYSEWFHHEYS